MKLFKSHITLLRKAATAIAYSQKLDGGTIMLCKTNEEKRRKAEKLIYEAMKLLGEIE